MNKTGVARSCALLFWGTCLALIFSQCNSKTTEYYMLVGTYTRSDSKGIYVMSFNTKTGDIKEVSTEEDIKNPSYLTVFGDQVYSVSETGRSIPGSLYSYNFDRKTGKLLFINKKPTEGYDPCYVEIDKSGKYVAIANYSSGSLTLLGRKSDGSLLDMIQVVQHEGGSADTMRQRGPHVHESVFSPDEKYLLTPDLGKDEVMIYSFNKDTQSPLELSKTIISDPGAGPRHMIFHPTLSNLYVIHEMVPYLTVYSYDSNNNYDRIQKLETWPDNFTGRKDGAELKISPDGKFLYLSHRGDQNSIDIFSVDSKTGLLTLKHTEPSGGKGPRDLEFDPSGNYLVVANEKSNTIVAFKRDKQTGLLTKASEIKVPMPTCVKFFE